MCSGYLYRCDKPRTRYQIITEKSHLVIKSLSILTLIKEINYDRCSIVLMYSTLLYFSVSWLNEYVKFSSLVNEN